MRLILLLLGILVIFGCDKDVTPSLPGKCDITGFGCKDVLANAEEDSITIYLTNTLGFDVSVSSITIDATSADGSTSEDCIATGAPSTWQNGDDAILALPPGCVTGNPRDVVEGEIRINYENLQTEVKHEARGSFSTRWE